MTWPTSKSRTTSVAVAALAVLTLAGCALMPAEPAQSSAQSQAPRLAALEALKIAAEGPKSGYIRQDYLNGWPTVAGCDVRNRVLARDLVAVVFRDRAQCVVSAGTLTDPYTGEVLDFQRGNKTSTLVQIDHVVALAAADRSGARQWPPEKKRAFAADMSNLKATTNTTNAAKSDNTFDAWAPPTAAGKCALAVTVIAVKTTWSLTVTANEKRALARGVEACPEAAA